MHHLKKDITKMARNLEVGSAPLDMNPKDHSDSYQPRYMKRRDFS